MQLNVAFTYQKSAPTCNCGHFVSGGFSNDCGFARDNVELYIYEGENMRGRKWNNLFSHPSPPRPAVFHGIGKRKTFVDRKTRPSGLLFRDIYYH